jgi:hypothetical protein
MAQRDNEGDNGDGWRRNFSWFVFDASSLPRAGRLLLSNQFAYVSGTRKDITKSGREAMTTIQFVELQEKANPDSITRS